MRNCAVLIAPWLLAACTEQVANTQPSAATKVAPTQKAVHSGVKAKLTFFDSVTPSCDVAAYPEVTVVKAPSHGTVTAEKGEDYPEYGATNVRHDCNRKLMGSTQLFYQSNAAYQGEDSFSIEVRWPTFSNVETKSYVIKVN